MKFDARDITPLIRIMLYLLPPYLAAWGVPREAAVYITSDPAVVNMIAGAISALPAVGAFVWWRLAKHFGWPT